MNRNTTFIFLMAESKTPQSIILKRRSEQHKYFHENLTCIFLNHLSKYLYFSIPLFDQINRCIDLVLYVILSQSVSVLKTDIGEQ